MAIFMKGDNWKGDVTTSQYLHWIACHSFEFGASNDFRATTAQGANRQGTHSEISEVTITKSLDPASLSIFRDTLTGKIHREIDFAFTRADKDNTAYLTIKLTAAGVSGSLISSTGDRPTEKVTLNFVAIEIIETTQNTDGSSAAPYAFKWNQATQTGG